MPQDQNFSRHYRNLFLVFYNGRQRGSKRFRKLLADLEDGQVNF